MIMRVTHYVKGAPGRGNTPLSVSSVLTINRDIAYVALIVGFYSFAGTNQRQKRVYKSRLQPLMRHNNVRGFLIQLIVFLFKRLEMFKWIIDLQVEDNHQFVRLQSFQNNDIYHQTMVCDYKP